MPHRLYHRPLVGQVDFHRVDFKLTARNQLRRETPAFRTQHVETIVLITVTAFETFAFRTYHLDDKLRILA